MKKISSFADFEISPATLESLESMGFSEPTEIQQQCIPVLLSQTTDLVALAETGTGKTGAFGIPLVEKVAIEPATIQALVLCPTRELCQQVATSLEKMGRSRRVRVLSIFGGDSYTRQLQGLKAKPHIVVSTPGRLLDLLERKAMNLKTVKVLVLDEADEMISMGFKDALEEILGQMSAGEDRNTWMFSATMSPEIQKLQKNYTRQPKQIEARTSRSPSKIEQQFMLVDDRDRLDSLIRYILHETDFYGLVFCQMKKEVADLELELRQAGMKVASLHGDKSQADRQHVIKNWKAKKVNVVVATDVAARGLDIEGLTHVVNYTLPFELETYIHRIGRTGRKGTKGIALSLVSRQRRHVLGRFEKALKTQWAQVYPPTPIQVQKKCLQELMTTLAAPSEAAEAQSASLDPLIKDHLKSLGLPPEPILIRFLGNVFRQSRPELFVTPKAPMAPPRKPEFKSDFNRRPRGRGRGSVANNYPR